MALDECPIFLTDAFIFPAPNLVKVVRRVFQDLELVEHDVCLERVGERSDGYLLPGWMYRSPAIKLHGRIS